MPNSATLLQALGAAFCAILCALSGMGGCGMMLGARTATWAKSGPTAKDYVQDGLIAMWDGIENAGWGVHRDTLVGGFPSLIGGFKDARYDYFFDDNSLLHTNNSSLMDRCDLTNDKVFSTLVNGDFTMEYRMMWSNDSTDSYSHSFQWLVKNTTGSVYTVLQDTSVKGSGMFYDCAALKNVRIPRRVVGSSTFMNCSVRRRSGYTEHFSDAVMDYSNYAVMPYVAADVVLPYHIRSYNDATEYHLYCLRFYYRALTDAEIAANYAIDKARFNLPDVA